MPLYYPINLDVSHRSCVVIGGGSVAARRVAGLLDAGATVRVVSPEITPDLQVKSDAGMLEWIAAPYSAEVLAGASLVFTATNRPEVNRQARTDAQALGIWVNAADEAELGDFVCPAVLRRSEFLIAIATGGAMPAFAAETRRELENRFGPEYGPYVELLGRMRLYIKETLPSEATRRAATSRLLAIESELLALLREGRSAEALERAQEETKEKTIQKTENRKQKTE